jgi:Protein of unknown function (DUF2934)
VLTIKKPRPILHTSRGKIVAPAAPRKSAAPPAADEPAVDRVELIAVAAYFRAEKRNFSPGGDIDDWLAAEREIDAAEPAAGKTAASA